MMITLNGKQHRIEVAMSIDALLAHAGYGGKTVAVAVNDSFVARESYSDYLIQDNDRVEIVAPMQGG